MAETSKIDEHPAAEWYRRDLDRVESELLTVVRFNMPRVGAQLIAHALIELCGSVLIDIVEAVPGAAKDIDMRLGELQPHVATAGQKAH